MSAVAARGWRCWLFDLTTSCPFASLTAIGVGVGAANSLRHVRSPFISVVRQRLFHPQGILLDLYGHHSHIADDLLSDELHRAFAPTTEADRLAVGVFFEDGRHIVRAKRNSAEVF